MDYLDFYDLAMYANENWRGGFSERETAENAYIYKVEFDGLGTDSPVIQSLLEQLKEDNTEEALEWSERIEDK